MFTNYCYMAVGGSIFLVHNLWKYSLHFPRIASLPEFSFFNANRSPDISHTGQ